MTGFLYSIVMQIYRIHNWILSWNDSTERYLTDKQLHFIVIGALGMALLFIVYPLFKALSKNHILAVAWIYVFTVMIVLAFAIEIGQGFTGTGRMDMDDVVAGMSGFMFMFIAFALLRGLYLAVKKLIAKEQG